MSKHFDDGVVVYTRDSVHVTNDDKKKQEIIDKWTDELAVKMAERTRIVTLDDGTVLFDNRSRRGGHNRKVIEALNTDGYITKVFRSVRDAAKFFDVSGESITRRCTGESQTLISPGVVLRYKQ